MNGLIDILLGVFAIIDLVAAAWALATVTVILFDRFDDLMARRKFRKELKKAEEKRGTKP